MPTPLPRWPPRSGCCASCTAPQPASRRRDDRALLDASRAHAGLAIWPTGEQALANVQCVGDLARRFERGGVLSFRAFVERLATRPSAASAAEAPIVEEGTEGVRIMTVHRAKGLEFPVVDPRRPRRASARSTASR